MAVAVQVELIESTIFVRDNVSIMMVIVDGFSHKKPNDVSKAGVGNVQPVK